MGNFVCTFDVFFSSFFCGFFQTLVLVCVFGLFFFVVWEKKEKKNIKEERSRIEQTKNNGSSRKGGVKNLFCL